MATSLRPEARPAKWEHLDKHQKLAFASVVKLIHQAVTDLPLETTPPRQSQRSAPWLDEERTSQTVFLSGERGSGKTTLLNSIIKETLDDLESSKEKPKDDDKKNAPDENVRKMLRRIQGRVIWLEPIGMETMPNSANLLSAILARIDDAVRNLVGGRSTSFEAEEDAQNYRPQGLLVAESQDAMLQLQRLQTDAALAWNSNLEARKGQLDPDSYAVEVQRCERARLAINQKLKSALDALANQAWRASGVRSPLFVLPVDDVDLNPLACLDLLRLLQMISVPRLFTLLLGDEQVASLVLNLKLSNDLARLFIDVREAQFLGLQPEFVGRIAGDIAANALRKLLPPSQRVRLYPMSLSEGLNFRPLGQSNSARLHELLQKCPLLWKLRVPLLSTGTPTAQQISVRDFVLAQGLPYGADPDPLPLPTTPHPKDDLSDAPYNFAYSGHKFFEAPPRRLADYWLLFQELCPENEPKPNDPPPTDPSYTILLDSLARFCKSSLLGDPKLLRHERDEVENGIVFTSQEKWELRRLPVHISNTFEHRRSFEELTSLGENKARFYVASHAGRFFALGAETGSTPAGSTVSPRPVYRTLTGSVVSELTIFHDLLVLGCENSAAYITSPLVLPPPMVGSDLMDIEWRSEAGASAILPWPRPPFRSFWENDLFFHVWNRVVTSDTSEPPVSWYAATWINYGTGIVNLERPLKLQGRNCQWDKLTPEVDKVVFRANNNRDWRSKLAREWLINLALLLMPESGLPREPVTPFLNSKNLKDFWSSERHRIVAERIKRLAVLLRAQMTDIVDKCLQSQMESKDFDPPPEDVYRAADIKYKTEDQEAARTVKQKAGRKTSSS